jgi:hypothetical protein
MSLGALPRMTSIENKPSNEWKSSTMPSWL